jgi:hypothetical protein
LGKTAAEAVTMLKEILRVKPWVKHECMSGLIISSELKCLLKTYHIVAMIL